METFGIYRIKHNKDNKIGYCIGLIKRKIKERIKEHKGDMCNNKENTVIAKIAQTENVNINYNNTKKLANFINRIYTFCSEAIEITSNNKRCKTIPFSSVDQEGNKSSKKMT